MTADPADLRESFRTWLLRRVAQAVEAGEVPALLADLQPEFEASRAKLRSKAPEQSQTEAIRDIAVELGMPVEKVDAGLAALEGQPCVVREALMRRIPEAGLAGQWRAHNRKGM
jgi:hypothetical protein